MAQPIHHANPFPGIRSYEMYEDELFFGRELQVSELIHKFSSTRFLAIVGSSGCGKSSLIKAGLVPALVKNQTPLFNTKWKVSLFRPGDDPIGNLARSLATSNEQVIRFSETLRAGKEGLVTILSQLDNPASESRLLIADQFEELFRFKKSRAAFHTILEASAFVELLLYAINHTATPVFTVFSMRTDFLDDCTEFRGLSEAINKGYYLVPRMNKEERRLAIVGPIEKSGGQITDELVEQVLSEVGDDPDQLPIMQHAMMRTWDFWALHRIGNQPVGTDHFKAIGTMKEALHVHLEEIYAELKDPKSKIIAEKLFKALTDITKESRGTRRPTQLSEICFLADAKEEEIIRIIDNFRKPGCAFLMPAASIAINADSIIDISHESIMRVWIRVRRWVEEESSSAQLYLRLSKSAELYQEGKTGLWVNPELQLALKWLSQNKPNATWAMRYDPAFDRAMTFLEYSRQQYEFELAKKENLQKRNLKRARNSAIILGIASLISILFLIISLNLRFKAEASRKEALEKEKLAVSESKRTVEQTKEAVLQKKISEQQQEIAEQQRMITEEQRKYAVKQQEIAQVQTSIAIDQKKKADVSRQEAVASRDEAQSQRKVALTQKQIADQERIKAEESEKNTYRLRMLSVAENLAITATQLSNTLKTDLPGLLAVTAQKLNNDYGGDASNPDIYAALSAISSDQVVLRGHEDAVRALALSRDGKTLYSCGEDNKLLIWNPENGQLVKINIILPKDAREPLRYLEISRDNQWMFAGNTSGALLVWKCSAMHETPKVFHAHTSVINSIAADPLKDMFVTAGSDGKLLQWDYANGSFKPTKLDSVSGKINCVAYSAEGNLAYGTGTGEVKIIAMKGQNKIPAILFRDTNPVTSLTYGKDGKWLTAGFYNGSILIWDMSLQNGHPREIIGQHISGITAVAFTADGKTLASSGFDRTIKMADFPSDESSPVSIKRHDGWIYDIVFTPDGKRIISCSADKTIRIMSIFSSDMAEKLTKKLTRNMNGEEWKKMVGEDIPYFKARQDLP